MSGRSRYEEFLICKERGHTASDITLACNPPLSVCRLCGTQYRYDRVLYEQNKPEPPDADGGG